MRVLLLALVLSTIAFAGCLDLDGFSSGSEEGQQDDQFDSGTNFTEIPERFFEPEVIMETVQGEIGQGDAANFTFEITDLHDYPYPANFIDWGIFYERDPNPVEEGDAFDLPGEYGRIIHAVDFHLFAFHVDDGQGFKETAFAVIQVGEPNPDTYPNATEMDDFEQQILEYYGELAEEVEETGEETTEEEVDLGPSVIERYWKAYLPEGCEACVDAAVATEPGAEGCVGWNAEINGIDCAWVDLNPGAAGQPYSVSSLWTPAGPAAGETVGEASPDVQFWDSCSPGGAVIESIIGSNGGTVEGVIPAGAGCMVYFDFSWPNGGLTVEFQWTETNDGFSGIHQTFLAPDTASCTEGAFDCEAEFCSALDSGWNGQGCSYVSVPPNAVGKDFLVSSPVDVIIFALDRCASDATELNRQDTGTNEAGTIGAGWGCLVAYAFVSNPEVITFDIAADA